MSALQRRPRLVIVGVAANVLVLVAALQGVNLWWRHDQILLAAETRAANLARLLAEYVRGSFAVADTSLRQLVVHGRRIGGTTAPGEAWAPILAAALETIPGHGSISVADSTGRIRHSTRPDLIGESRSDQFIFRHLRPARHDGLVVDAPFLTLTPSRRYILPIGRRLERGDGSFDGVVVSTVDPGAFRELFRTLDVGGQGITWALHPDEVVVLREPAETDPIGMTARHHPLLLAARETPGTGVVIGALEPGGPPFVSAYHTLSTPPLVVGVSLSRAEILADWSTQVRGAFVMVGALAAMLTAIVRVLVRQIDARTLAEQELRDVQRLEAERIRESHERLEASLAREQRARYAAEQAGRLKDEFLMTLSHELRTPLTAIYGWVRMLGAGAIPPAQQAEALAAIERNARAQTRLIEDLLDVSAAISGKLRLEARPCSLVDVARAAVETLEPAVKARQIHLETAFETELGPITADPDRVQQIVWNLLSNAIKFTPEGGNVTLNVARAGTGVEIVVGDTGIGIAPEFLPYVFERFRQGEAGTRRRFGGLGLGLAIVRHLAELHGGTARVESTGEGQGATFRVFLPARALPQPAISEGPSVAIRSPSPPARLDAVRVLVVDDDADARELFASILQRAGATVQTAASAADGLRLLAAGTPHVLVSDIEMPVEDGYELLRRGRALASTRDAPFVAVAVTAHARAADRHRAVQAGYEAHVAKPVEPDGLVSAVASALLARADIAVRR